MTNLRRGNGDRWLVIGDSNDVSRQEEKLGGLPFNPNDERGFFDFIDTTWLLDLSISGGTFSWLNQRSDEEAILEKLDRVLCSNEWNITFPKVVALLDIAIGSDHAPIIVLPKGLKRKYRRDFKFESKWFLEEDCACSKQLDTSLAVQTFAPIRELKECGNFDDGCALISFLLWALWKSRNAFAFEALLEKPWEVWNRAEGAFMEFLKAQQTSGSGDHNHQEVLPSWIPPLAGQFKVLQLKPRPLELELLRL
ncbi:hypothetical protein V6N11_037097 [Hibiscus sabdariffa]